MAVFAEWRQIHRRVFSLQQTGVFLILVVGLTLATVMFSIGYNFSINSLPYKDKEKLVMIGIQTYNDSRVPLLPLNIQLFHEWRERSDLFSGVAAYSGRNEWRLSTPNGNIVVRGQGVTANFFDVLGVWFPGHEAWKQSTGTRNLPAVVFTHRLGTQNFGLDSMGQLYRTQGGDGIIAGGILPANFVFPSEALINDPREYGVIPVPDEDVGPTAIHVVGRLAPGITPQIAEQALNSGLHGNKTSFEKIEVKFLSNIIMEASRPIVLGTWALSGLVLILCIANLSGILLVRISYRLREYAIRTSLGAGFLDLTRLIFIELAAISVSAAIFACFLARGFVSVVGNMLTVRQLSFGWDTTAFVIVGTVIISITSVIASLAVIGRNYRRGFSLGEFAVFRSQRWIRMFLTIGQVAIVMLLLSLSYFTVRGYIDIFTQNANLDTSTRIVTAEHSPTYSSSMMMRKSIMEDVLTALRVGDPSIPVAVYEGSLFNNRISTFKYPFRSTYPVGRILNPEEISGLAFTKVSPGFFRIAKVAILAGREFDNQYHSSEILINASFARRMGWTPDEAVGQLLDPNMVVIGVVDDFPTESWDGTIPMTVFQSIESMFDGNLILRGRFVIWNYIIHPDAIARIGNVERMIVEVDPGAVITRNAAWSDLLGESVRGQRFAAISAVLFTIAGIAIVVIGISNTVMFIIARRTKDIAIHIAVGAQAKHVCWFVVRDMVISGFIGMLTGVLASWWVCRLVTHHIFDVDRYLNLSGLLTTSIAMVLVIAAASLLPALRALRIEPSHALNLE